MSDSIDLVVLIIVAMLVQSPIFDVVIEVLVLYNRVDRVSSDSVQIAVIKQQDTTNRGFLKILSKDDEEDRRRNCTF